MPYLYSLMWEATQTGAPVLRPLLWHFPGDAASVGSDDQAMLGPWILAAPVLEEGALSQTTTLPPGRWMELRSGALYDGPGVVETNATWQALPLYVRQGAIVPKGPVMQHTGEALDPLTLDVFPADEATTFTLYEDDGATTAYQAGEWSTIPYTLQGSGTGATLSAGPREGAWTPPARQLVVRVRAVDVAPTGVTLDGVALGAVGGLADVAPGGSGWAFDGPDRAVLVTFPDGADWTLELTYDPTIPRAGARRSGCRWS